MAVYKIAQTADVKLIDIRSALCEHRDYCAYLNTEDIHPNEDWHGLIAKAVAQQIEQLILS